MKLSRRQIMDVIFGIIFQIYFLFPGIKASTIRYNFLTYLLEELKIKDSFKLYKLIFFGRAEGDFPDSAEIVALWLIITVIVLLAVQIIELVYVIVSLCDRRIQYIRNIIGAIAAVIVCISAYMQFNISTGISEEMVKQRMVYVTIYLCAFLVIKLISFIIEKMEDEWDEASQYAREEKERQSLYKKERKRRLNFPGRYSGLYYQVRWKTLRHRWSDFSFLFFSVFLSSTFLFVGISMRSVFSESYGEDQGLLGLGLMESLLDFVMIIIFISLFLVTIVLVFYRKRRMGDDGIFRTLGIRSNAEFVSWIGELLIGFVIAVICSLFVGRVLIFSLCHMIEKLFPALGTLGEPGQWPYLGTVLGMTGICLFAFGFSHDIHAAGQSVDTRNVAARSEELPGEYGWFGLAVGLIVGMYAIYRYSQRRTAESMIVLCVFFLCLYLVINHLWGFSLKCRRKHSDIYFSSLPKQHMVYHRYKTSVRYMALLTVIHIGVLFFFCMRMVSQQIATDPEELFPYDYMFLGDSTDDTFVKELEDECQGEIFVFPMVRVTTLDNTERLEHPMQIVWQQGQNIGISESTYKELKELAGETPNEDLGLDKDGSNVYIVYQQDQGTKAKPLDWYQMTKEPYIHIGQPLFAYETYDYDIYYPRRKIVGEEVSSLTGIFRQGKYENLVVFSDEYFDQIKDSWKTTNMYTGELVGEEEAILEENIHEGPSMLILANIPEEYREKADGIMGRFQEKHKYDESFDVLVKSTYSKSDAVKKREMEHILNILINGFVIVLLLMTSIMLLYMKGKTELPEMRKRYHFMECFGMCQKERMTIEKKEVSRFVIIPLLLGIVIAVIFTFITFHLRDFDKADMMNYLIFGGILWIAYIGIQILCLKLLQNRVVNKIEKNIER